MENNLRLSHKRILVTGALGGQGRVACRMFGAAGAKVIGTDLNDAAGRDFEEELLAEGVDFSFIAADMTDADHRDKLVKNLNATHDYLDGLYLNHGVILGKSLFDTTDQDWDRVHDVDLKSVFFLVQAIAPMMFDRSGSIVIVSSTGGLIAVPNMAAYAAAKAGAAMLARSLAVDLAPHSIRVNAICPGVIDTDMPRKFVSELEHGDAVLHALEQSHVLKRLGRSEEVVSMGLYLLSDEASFMTGAVLPVDGGMSAI